MPKIHANGIDIYYEVHGPTEAMPLVLIAGIGYDHWVWHKMVPGFAQNFQVITFDNRGVGQTEKPPGPYTAQMLAADTAGLMRGLQIPKAAVLGHSMGGFVAQALALDYAEMVDKLILAATSFGGPHHIPVTPEAMAVLKDTTLDPVERFKRGIAVSTAPGFAESHPEIIQEWVTHTIQNPIQPAAYQAQYAVGDKLFEPEACFEGKLREIDAPTLILFGEHDQVMPPGNAELLANEIQNSQIVILPNAGHFFPFETPEAAVQAVTDFLLA